MQRRITSFLKHNNQNNILLANDDNHEDFSKERESLNIDLEATVDMDKKLDAK